MYKKSELDKELQILEKNLPWSLSILSLIKSKDYISIFRSGVAGNIGILNKFNEWIVFTSNINELKTILEYINSFNIKFRVIIFSKQYLDIPRVYRINEIHFEDLMYMEGKASEKDPGVRLATEQDIETLASLQSKYCNEEITWKYYHKDIPALKIEYTNYIKNKDIFVIGEPAHSKVEITLRYGDNIKIGRIYTENVFRRKGFGSACLRGVINWCSYNGLSLSLNVRRKNIGARQMYEKSGFQSIGQVIYLVLGERDRYVL